ncbi:amino acid ABC transporter substrate-binding protein [Aliikangiella marina]|uniref:Amino acid ABC transporter substrate-binding protein n=1 Tax=Aliikangiella marina TaxID=1712262 RepID=A0A545T6Z9_9GAMM|nr:amino acid ABC transporter substrate-binding protein [Aliikangiella marina]
MLFWLNTFLLVMTFQVSAAQATDNQSEKCILKYGWADWAPLQYVDTSGKLTGVQIELVKAVTDAVGCKIEFIKLPWSQIIQQIESGELDFTANATKDDFRSRFAYFSNPYRRDTFSFWVPKSRKALFDKPSVDEIMRTGAKLGLVANQLYSDDIKAWENDPNYGKNIAYAEEIADLLSMLKEGQVDIAVEDPYLIAYRKRIGLFSDDFTRLGIRTFGYEVSFMFSKKSTSMALVEQFNSKMRELKSTPVFQTIWMNPELIK